MAAGARLGDSRRGSLYGVLGMTRAGGWLIALALSAVFLIAVWYWGVRPQIFRVVVCDAWSVELTDGTLLTPPPDAIQGETREGFGPCWTLPAGVTADDLR